MFASIRKHQKWLWVVISAAVIISFVVYFTPDANVHLRGFGDKGAFGRINGREVTREEAFAAQKEAALRYRFFSGAGAFPHQSRGRQNWDENRETQTRLFVLEKIKEVDVRVSEQAVADWIAAMFRDENGKFRLDAYQNFTKRELPGNGLTESDLVRFAKHEVALQHLIEVVGVSGQLVTPKEAEALYRSQNEQLVASVVMFSSSNQLASVQVNPEGLKEFYTNQVARYRTPDKVQVDYVRFDTSPGLAEADKLMATRTNLAQVIDAVYQQRGTNYYVDSDGRALPAEAAKERVREELRQREALVITRRQANAFAEELFEKAEKEPGKRDHLEKIAAAKGLTLQSTAPFAMDGPADLNVPQDFIRAAFSLSEESPYSAEITGTNAVFVLALKKKIPSETQSLDDIRAKVTEDYRLRLAQDAARQAGRAFHQTLVNGLSQGKSFETVCAEANLKPIKLTAFTPSSRALPELEGRISVPLVKDIATKLADGKASDFTEARDGGFVLFLHSRMPAAEDKLKEELPKFVESLRQERMYDAFNEWYRKERESANLQFASDSTSSK